MRARSSNPCGQDAQGDRPHPNSKILPRKSWPGAIGVSEQKVSHDWQSDKQQSAMHSANRWGVRLAEVSGICSLSAGCPHLPRRLSSPSLECMRECTHFVKAEQPRNLGYMQLTVIEVTNRQIAP